MSEVKKEVKQHVKPETIEAKVVAKVKTGGFVLVHNGDYRLYEGKVDKRKVVSMPLASYKKLATVTDFRRQISELLPSVEDVNMALWKSGILNADLGKQRRNFYGGFATRFSLKASDFEKLFKGE